MSTYHFLGSNVFRGTLKTIEHLKVLSAADHKLVAAFKLFIAKGKEAIDQQVLPALASYTLGDLFKLSEACPEIKELCRSELHPLWQDRFNRLNYTVSAEANSSIFDKLMGGYLAHYYELYQDRGLSTSIEANRLLMEARERGLTLDPDEDLTLDDHFDEPRPYSSAAPAA